MDKKIVGVFKSEESAIFAIKKLKMDGYSNEDISVIAKQRSKLDRIEDITNVRIEPETTSGAAAGALAGGMLGGIAALLVEFGVFAIPGIGPLLAVGPIAVTLAGIAAGGPIAVTLAGIAAGGAVGGVSGALIGTLIDMGFTEADAKEYQKFLDEGNILVLVDERNNRLIVNENFYQNDSLIKDKYKKEEL